MKLEMRPFHLRVVKFAGELDLAHAIFRGTKINVTIQQMRVSKNEYDLPVETDILAELQITEVTILNRVEETIRFAGGAINLRLDTVKPQQQVGKTFHHFAFRISMKSRTGEGVVW